MRPLSACWLLIGLLLVPLHPAAAQRLTLGEAAAQVYLVLPQLPREDQYRPASAGDREVGSTLVQRLIRYHQLAKSRSVYSRLDWKLTVADYLGAYDYINPDAYPGAETLSQNPLEGDRAAVRRLSRAQREQLVQTLVNLFNTGDGRPIQPNSATAGPAPAPATDSRRPQQPPPPLPRPGDAQLLGP